MKLICDSLTCERGGRRVFENVTFQISSGEALIVRGPNGVGKSSLLRVIAGLVAVRSGKMALEGGIEDRTVPEHCHYFGHLDALKPSLTALENLSFWRSFYEPVELAGFSSDATLGASEALETLEIGHTAHLPAAFLSAGQRRRLSLARLLVVPRPIWIMDEPSSALDAASERTLLGLMASHINGGGIIIAATHLPLDLPNTKYLEFSRGDGRDDEGLAEDYDGFGDSGDFL
ncbi:heme ABC exporter ATP-binding protein CcmA [Rhodobacteraceae bacterium RKSG542]|uniref:heme ABC exporter ATP-binding protein CcmA n=1 Tax=Pseudovibrio flavus TaxID=2529854 RepID=UPI0012BC02E8|nr:heme ABC exporter ATP-binding protein CcmA [Pseudovibrio flavus]MTI18401.1 heme ABC exporter ATP-binding protein CcmA [Pseudovibrio flavus]